MTRIPSQQYSPQKRKIRRGRLINYLSATANDINHSLAVKWGRAVVWGRGNTAGNLTLLALPGPFISYDFLFIIPRHFTVYILLSLVHKIIIYIHAQIWLLCSRRRQMTYSEWRVSRSGFIFVRKSWEEKTKKKKKSNIIRVIKFD